MFAVRGYSVVTVAEHVKPEVLFQHICRVRGGKGIKIIPVDGPLLGLMRALKRNDIVGLAADLDVTKSGLVIDFFGSPTRLPDGHVQLALRTGATIVPAFTLRRPDNTFEAHVEPPIEFESTGDAAASLRAGLSTSFECEVRTGVTKIAALMEHYIGQHPEQWVMFNPIWDAVRDQDR
jgi:KDO2-lipid IV(A) lauroyltransferase